MYTDVWYVLGLDTDTSIHRPFVDAHNVRQIRCKSSKFTLLFEQTLSRKCWQSATAWRSARRRIIVQAHLYISTVSVHTFRFAPIWVTCFTGILFKTQTWTYQLLILPHTKQRSLRGIGTTVLSNGQGGQLPRGPTAPASPLCACAET
jgi:hypothetical protein